jgi:hypothetical protein
MDLHKGEIEPDPTYSSRCSIKSSVAAEGDLVDDMLERKARVGAKQR